MQGQDHYEELGVAPESDLPAIRKAYRQRALNCHPDRGGDEEEFKRIQGAYECLSDVLERALFDATRRVSQTEQRAERAARAERAGKQKEESAGAGGQHGPPPPTVPRDNGTSGDTPSSSRSRGHYRGDDGRGKDEAVQYPVTLEQQFNGVLNELTLTIRVVCPTCKVEDMPLSLFLCLPFSQLL